MKSVKYAIIGAVIGLSLGGLLSIGVVGSHSACEGVNGCFGCIKMCPGGCADCLSWWITPVKPILYGTCGCFGVHCSNACIDYWDCTDGCDGGCFNGCDNGLDECNKGCGNCGYSKCTQGCMECSNGCESECNNTQEGLSNDPDAKKKIKNYLIYLTIIGSIIAGVYGIVCDIQDKEKKRRERRIREEEQRKLSCSKRLIFEAGKNDRNAVLDMLEQGADVNYQDSYGDTPLLAAVTSRNVDMTVLLLEKGADIECKSKNGFTPLQLAVSGENKEIVSLLIERDANVECETERGTPLQLAVTGKNKEIVSLLIEKGANIEHETENGFPPLQLAVSGGNKEIISLLIEKGANIEREAGNGMTPLQYAVLEGIIGKNKEIISLLIEKGANVNYVSKDGTTPLSMANTGGSEEIVSFLIGKGADVNVTTMNNGFTVLQSAICNKNKKIILILLAAGAEINRNSHKIETALLSAIDKVFYDSEIVSLLIEKGADVNLESAFNGHTPLTFAVSQNNKDAALLLLKNGAEPNKKSGKFGSPLMIAFQAANKEMCSLLMENGANSDEILWLAAVMQSTEVMQFFLDRGADVNCEDSGGLTPLKCAILANYKEMVLLLISHGADVNFERSGASEKNAARTPLESAIITGNAEMVSLLITYGADVNYKTKNGNTPLLFAALHGKSEIVPLLKEAGAVSNAAGKSAQMTAAVATNRASSDVQDDSVAFNAALVALSKIIAKNGAEIFAPENSQKLKALVSDLLPQENEIASKLRQALSCDFASIILDATDKSDGKKEKSFGEAVDTITAETGLEKEAAVSMVKLVALALDWDLESVTVQ